MRPVIMGDVMKKCSFCKVDKDESCFSKLQTRCKECDSLYQKRYREKNKQRISAYFKDWYETKKEDPEWMNQKINKDRDYRSRNLQLIRERQREYYKRKSQDPEWYQRRLEQNRECYRKNSQDPDWYQRKLQYNRERRRKKSE